MGLKAVLRERVRQLGLAVDRWPARHTLEAALQQVAEIYQVDSVVDVGANEGDWSAGMRQLGYCGPILSIEPGTSSIVALRRRAEKDGLWTVRHAAVGSTNGEATLNVSARSTLSSMLAPEPNTLAALSDDALRRIEVVGQETVELVTLDSLEVPGHRVLLKVDTQGTDRAVLAGAPTLLQRTVAVQCELSVVPLYLGVDNEWRAMVDYLSGLGFSLAGLFAIATDESMRLVELDGLFVRARGLSGAHAAECQEE